MDTEERERVWDLRLFRRVDIYGGARRCRIRILGYVIGTRFRRGTGTSWDPACWVSARWWSLKLRRWTALGFPGWGASEGGRAPRGGGTEGFLVAVASWVGGLRVYVFLWWWRDGGRGSGGGGIAMHFLKRLGRRAGSVDRGFRSEGACGLRCVGVRSKVLELGWVDGVGSGRGGPGVWYALCVMLGVLAGGSSRCCLTAFHGLLRFFTYVFQSLASRGGRTVLKLILVSCGEACFLRVPGVDAP